MNSSQSQQKKHRKDFKAFIAFMEFLALKRLRICFERHERYNATNAITQMNLQTIKQNLLSNPSGINAASAIARLSKQYFGDDAKYLLDRMTSAQIMDQLLKKALPDEWAKIKGNAFIKCRELRKIINRDYFPMRDDVLDDWCFQAAHGDMEIEMIDIPLYIYGHGNWIHDQSFDDLCIENKLISLLDGDYVRWRSSGDLGSNFKDLQREYNVDDSCQIILNRFYSLELIYHDELSVLEEAFENKRNPSRHFPLAFRAFHLSTDNMFFDWDDEAQMQSGETFEWDKDTLLYIKEEHEKAKPILKNITRLNRWLEARPKERIEYFFNCIGRVLNERKSKRKQRIRVGSVPVRTLVDVLSGADT